MLQHPPRDLPLQEQLPRARARAASPLTHSVVCLHHHYLTDSYCSRSTSAPPGGSAPLHARQWSWLLAFIFILQKKSRLSVYPCERWRHVPGQAFLTSGAVQQAGGCRPGVTSHIHQPCSGFLLQAQPLSSRSVENGADLNTPQMRARSRGEWVKDVEGVLSR